MLLSEEEKKKKEEEAKSIINMNNIGSTINSINYANLKNIKIETNNDEENNFINKVNEANNIINSINPRHNEEAPSISKEERAKSIENAQSFLDLMDNNSSLIQTDELLENNEQQKSVVNEQQEEKGNNDTKGLEIEKPQNSSSINRISHTSIDELKNIKISLANQEQTKDLTEYQPKEKNVFLAGLKWIKDFIVSIPASIVSKGYGIGKTVKEGHEERTEMLNNMSDEQALALDNKNKSLQDLVMGKSVSNAFDQTSIIGNIDNVKTKLYIKDTIQDTARSVGNSAISMANNVLNFFSFGNLGKNTIPEIQDFSVLQNSEQYGSYSSQEELSKAIQSNVTDAYKEIDIYNPTANKWGGVSSDVIVTLALGGAGMNTTSAVVTTSGLSTLGETGSVEEATKSIVTSYVFSKVLDSKVLSQTVKEPTSKATQNIVKKIITKNPEIIDTELKKAIVDTLPESTSTFASTLSSRIVANELGAIANNGVDTFNGEVQKNIIADSLIWATLSAAQSGYKGVNFKIHTEQLNEADATNQLKEWYETLGLDSEKQYTADEVKKQYRTLAKQYHSDVVGGSDEKMIDINLAYEGINKYLQDGTIYKTTIKSEPTNENPTKTDKQSQANNEYGIVKTDEGFYMNSNSVLNSTATSIANTQTIEATTAIKNDNGDVIGFEKVKAVPFRVENSQIADIQPAVTKTEDGTINVIDVNSGAILLSNAKDIPNAITQTTEALQSTDNVKQEYIRNEVTKTRYNNVQAIDTMISNLKNNVEHSNNENVIDVNRQISEVSALISPISSNAVYNNEKATDIFKAVADKVNNVEVVNQGGFNFIRALDKEGKTSHIERINKSLYTGAKIKQIIDDVVTNAHLSDIVIPNNDKVNATQTSINQNTGTLQSNQTSYTPEKVQTITEPFNKQQEYTKEEMAEVWNNEIDSKDLQNIYDDKGNSQGYVSIEQDGDNLIVKNYDNNDNVIASEIIQAKKNGKYSSRAITNAINKVTGVNTKVQENHMNNMQQDTNIPMKNLQKSTVNSTKTVKNEKNSSADDNVRSMKQSTNKLAKSGNIKYNNKGIKLRRNEYAGVVNAINTDHPNLSTGINYKCYGDYFYIFDKLDFNNYVFKGKIKIIDNEQIINKIMKEVDNNDRTTRSINRLFEVSKNGQTVYSSNNINVRNTKTTTGNGRLSSKSIQTDQKTSNTRTTNIEKSNGNNQSGGLRGRGELITDNQGRQLSKQQQEFFKDSKVRDEKGNLLTVYHGTTSEFNVFNYDKLGKNTSSLGAGFYFTDRKETGEEYSRKSGNLKEVYLDIKKPMGYMQTLMTKNEYEKFIKAVDKETNGTYLEDYDGLDNALMEYNYGGDDIDLVNAVHGASGLTWKKTYELLRETTGFDGIISEEGFLNNGEKLYVTFNSNQIKNVDNINPTSNPDIRYMKKSTSNKANTRTQVAVDENIQKELHNRIQNAIISKNSRKNTFLGKVTQKVANTVKRLYGIDVSGRNHIISDYDIRHMINQHGNTTIEKTKGQIAITTKDIERIPDIINNYDKIEKGSINTNSITGENSNSIRYIKQYKGNISYVVEVVPNTGNTLQIKTMWKKSVNTNKKKPIGLSHDNKILPYTSETKSKSASNISIPQNQQNVKNNDVVFKNTYRSNNTNNITDKTKNNADDKSTNIKKTGDFITEIERQKMIKKSKHNGERPDAYIEQAIVNVELNKKWDENIKAISTTDILDFINQSFNDKIAKGHFNQRAYAIYKENQDIIRTKSYKDIDSIVHEVFHRIFNLYNVKQYVNRIQDEVLTEEVLELYANGNLNNTDMTNEGWAEMGRRYIVQQDYIEKNMPETVKVLNEIRQENPNIDKFITELQQKVHDYIYEAPWDRDGISYAPRRYKTTAEETLAQAKKKVIKGLLNQDYAIEDATDYMVKGLGYINSYELDIDKNPVVLNALKQGIGEKIDSILKDGIYDLETGEKLCDGIAKISDILTTTEDLKHFNSYLVALRSIEAAEKGKKTGIRYDSAVITVEHFSQDKRMEEAKIIFQKFNNTLLQEAVKSGLYSQEQVDLMKETWLDYAPLYRVMDNERTSGGLRKNPILKFTGSERDIINPLEGTIITLGRIYPAIQRNKTLQSFVEIGQTSFLGGTFYDIIPTPVQHIATEKLSDFKKELENQGIDTDNLDLKKVYEIFVLDHKDNPKELITSYRVDGEEMTIQFKNNADGKELYKVFTGGYTPDVPGTIKKFLIKSAEIFRYGTTILNPKFFLNNISSDTQQASMNAKGNFIPYKDSIIGLANVIIARGENIPPKIRDNLPPEIQNMIKNPSSEYVQNMRKMYALFKQSGGSGGTRTSLYTNRNLTSVKMADIMNANYKELGLKKKPLKKLVHNASLLSELSEEATRFQVFLKDMQKLNKDKPTEFYKNLIDSAYNTRNATQDFSTGGTAPKSIAPYVPYILSKTGSVENSRIIYKQILGESKRAYEEGFNDSVSNGASFEEAKQEGTKRLAKTWAKKILMTALYTSLGFLTHKLFENNEEYEEINQQQKYNNYYFKIRNQWLKVKKAQGEARLWINLGQYFSQLSSGDLEDKEVSELIGIFWNAVQDAGISDDISTFTPPLLATIFELTANYDLYYGNNIVPNYMKENSEPKDWYNENTTELSKELGALLNISPMHIDYFIKNAFGTLYYDIWATPDNLLGMSSNYPSKANTSGTAFTVNPYSNSSSVNELYDVYNKMKQKEGSGTLTQEDEELYKNVSTAISSLSKINKQIKEVKKDLTMSSSEKEKQLLQLQKERTDTARQALGKSLIHPENEQKIQSTQFYPTNSSLSKNNYELQLTSEMKTEYEQIASEYYSKYESQGIYNEEKLKDIKSKAKEYAKSQLFKKYKSELVRTKKK